MTRYRVIAFFVIIFFATSILSVFHKALAFDCLTLTTDSSQQNKDSCRQELAQIEAQLADLLARQKEQQKQSGTLKGDVDFLNSQIAALTTKVKARALKIASLKVDIKNKVTAINILDQKINREHESLAQLLRNTNEFDNENVVHLILSDDSVSNFYSDFESYSSIKQAVKDSVDQINGIKTLTEAQKKDLETKKNAEADAKAQLEDAQKKVAQSEAEKAKLLAISKGQEAAYQQLAAQKKAQADKIRAALFPLAGISQKIEFGTALLYANEVKDKLGVDPAFLLAILTQESNLGANVGQCYLADSATGAGVGKNTGIAFSNVMKPSRDIAPFLSITSTLGFDPYKTAVSCPIAGILGYGGAMGPAQFIPSTWQLFAARLQAALGHFANPWSPEDSFIASGMYLSDLGAVGTSQSSQNSAACKYYGSGGSRCSYASNVARLKKTIQSNIDLLSGQ